MDLFVLCITIFIVRILDVALGTFRMIVTVKGKTVLATIIGFVEVTIWFLIVKDALNSGSNSWWIVFSYAGGFAAGTYIGGILSAKLLKSSLSVQVIIEKEHSNLVNILRNNGFAVSVIDAKGFDYSDKLLLFSEIKSPTLAEFEKIVREYEEKAFMVVNETKYVQNGYFRDIVK